MDALIADEIAKIRIRERHEDAERWRRSTEARGRVPVRSPADRWYLWRFIEPDPEYYGRGW